MGFRELAIFHNSGCLIVRIEVYVDVSFVFAVSDLLRIAQRGEAFTLNKALGPVAERVEDFEEPPDFGYTSYVIYFLPIQCPLPIDLYRLGTGSDASDLNVVFQNFARPYEAVGNVWLLKKRQYIGCPCLKTEDQKKNKLYQYNRSDTSHLQPLPIEWELPKLI